MGLVYKNAADLGLEVLSCKGEQNFHPHLHDGYVLWLNSESGERYELQGGRYILETGSISIIEPGIIHANCPLDVEKRHLRSFYLSKKFFSGLSKQLWGDTNENLTFPTAVLNHPLLWRTFLALHEKYLHTTSPLDLEAATVLAFAELLNALSREKSLDRETDASEKRVERIVDYFHAHLAMEIPLETLASIAGCTSYHLIRLFRQKKGMPPHAYLVQLRLEHARRLLLSGKPIVNAALESGFSDQSHLTRQFKKRYGMTPGAYLIQNTA